MKPWELKLALLALILVALLALVFWWRWRIARREAADHAADLAKFAAMMGGTATDVSGDVAAWSAGLLRPFAREYGDVIGWLGRVSDSQFEHALDFERNGWQVRVTEASIQLQSPSNADDVNTHYEHRIEVATADLVPLKLMDRTAGGGEGARRWTGEMPRSVADGPHPQWQELRLPAVLEPAFVACTSDLHRAAAMFNPEVTQRLRAEAAAKDLHSLTLEAGIAYAVLPGQIDPQRLLQEVDAVTGLLERIPGSRPRNPAAAV
ncbi:hypothetical protein BBK82_12425 [Lentzea guizhouensis]|uniref:Uncharacterized protein n=1 Tax=Lentzea guizhouensis TaxID=1586287 RepID=A0A1B2HGB0_9PSEU|nr:hypothetical protein [Lentzea guizhouensis]ANZ36753.1 hypothetical protein BBK82_12425 [Lentzea guizhouensis]